MTASSAGSPDVAATTSPAGAFRSLQRAEARARATLLEVTAMEVDLDLTVDEATFGSRTRLRFTSRGGPTFVDLKPLRVGRLELNGTPLDAGLLDRGRLAIETVAGENELVVEAVMGFRHDGEGLHRSVDPADGRHYVYGMSFMDAAPSIFACFDQPDLKAPYTLTVRAPRDWQVFGNAPATSPEAGLWALGPTPPLASYVVTLLAGPYHVLHDQHDGIALRLSSRQSLAGALDADAEDLLAVTRAGFDTLHRLFGIRYAFGDYHQAFVPEFNAGAMENPGCVTFRDQMLSATRLTRSARIQRATTVAHELAHQWFGNLVTPRWWDDLWLNESFAEYLGNRVTAEATEYRDALVDNAYQRRSWGLVADLGPHTHPVAGNGAVDATAALQDFDGISYAKGASILRQLAAGLGDDVFLGGVRDLLTGHRFGNATMADLVGCWERAGAGDLSAFVDQWLRTAGPDRLELDRSGAVVRRTPPPAHPAERRHAVEVAVAGPDGAWSRERLVLDAPATGFDAGDRPVVLDPDEDTWAQTLLDPVTVAALPGLLPALDDERLRATVWNQVRSTFHAGALDPATAVGLVVAAPPVEDLEDAPERALPRRTMPWVVSELLPLAPPGSTARVHAALRTALAGAAPGSERQHSAFRGAVRTAEDPEVLRGWLAQPPAGIAADLDVRWRLLVRLAVLGATTVAELDAERAAAPGGHAQVEHVRARASLPDPDAKAWAWRRLTGEEPATNYELEAAGLGLWRPGQEALTAPYVERYFALVPDLARLHTGWLLGVATEAFFPATATEQRTLDLAAAAGALPGLDPTVRRRLDEAADLLARRVAVRREHPW